MLEQVQIWLDAIPAGLDTVDEAHALFRRAARAPLPPRGSDRRRPAALRLRALT